MDLRCIGVEVKLVLAIGNTQLTQVKYKYSVRLLHVPGFQTCSADLMSRGAKCKEGRIRSLCLDCADLMSREAKCKLGRITSLCN